MLAGHVTRLVLCLRAARLQLSATEVRYDRELIVPPQWSQHFSHLSEHNLTSDSAYYHFLNVLILSPDGLCGFPAVSERYLPGEAVLTMRSPLIHCQHVGVGRAGEHQLPHREVPHSPQPVAFARTLEALRPLYTFVLHGFFRLWFFGQILPTAAATCVRSASVWAASSSLGLLRLRGPVVAHVSPCWRGGSVTLFFKRLLKKGDFTCFCSCFIWFYFGECLHRNVNTRSSSRWCHSEEFLPIRMTARGCLYYGDCTQLWKVTKNF